MHIRYEMLQVFLYPRFSTSTSNSSFSFSSSSSSSSSLSSSSSSSSSFFISLVFCGGDVTFPFVFRLSNMVSSLPLIPFLSLVCTILLLVSRFFNRLCTVSFLLATTPSLLTTVPAVFVFGIVPMGFFEGDVLVSFLRF
uniref:Uncharacterized protein n=1 Tax=Cacopsylla melanoneura TaxID=428564 RepID=A0A8D9DQZ7_9HEMI